MAESSQAVNGVPTSNFELNGGVGYHQPSHYAKAETSLDQHGNTHVVDCYNIKDDVQIISSDSHSGNNTKCGGNLFRNKNSGISAGRTCHRKWNKCEKYLLTICVLLVLACLTFILIAFRRDSSSVTNNTCSDSPVIHSVNTLPQANTLISNQPSITLICNLTLTPDDPNDLDTKFWWTLPNGRNKTGNRIVLDGNTGHGVLTCFVERNLNGQHHISSTSITIQGSPEQETCLTSHCILTAAQLIGSMDSEIDPCDDFFQFACGNWNRKNLIPEDRTSYNTFEKLSDELTLTLRALLEDAPNDYDSNATLKAKVLYQSCTNTTQIEIVGDTPLREALADLGGWPVISKGWSKDQFELETVLGKMRGEFNAPILLDVWIGPDDKNSSVNIIQLDEPALGMPSREYYLHSDDSTVRKAYLKFMCDVATLMGANKTTVYNEMSEVLQFETVIARLTKPHGERQDTGARYNKMTVARLQRKIPKFDWLKYFQTFLPDSIDGNEEIIVFAPNYLDELVKFLEKKDKRVISNYVFWRMIFGTIPELPMKYQEVRAEYRKASEGVMRDKPRWNKCVEYINKRLGVATGAMFVHKKFRKESKDVALEMISNLRAAFIDLLHENDWMDNDTRAVAEEKALAIRERIGYPDFIVDPVKLDKKIEKLHFESDQYFENILRVEKFDADRIMMKYRKPVLKDAWEQDPAVVNAFYNPHSNEIVFPAGVLQPPFYSEYFPKSLNYGGIGVVIGHEITHGFDDKGRQYDKDGNMKQWWKNGTIQAFQKRIECIINQYFNVKLEQIDTNIDGKNTQGENIADNGGLKQAYRAYKKWETLNGPEPLLPGLNMINDIFQAYKKWESVNGPEPLLPGLNMTHDQLFFLNFAQIWCGNMRDKAALEEIRTSPHSPGPIRARLPLANSHDFARAYSCPLGSRMNPVHKCSVW
ncbi:Membrane metallo-endopeptidase-like 1 [Mactra antiquata]